MQKPVLQALILADHIYEDRLTGKKIISGTFNRIWSTKFPDTFHGPAWAFIALTDIRGKIGVELQFRSQVTAAQEILMKYSGISVEARSPLETCELSVAIPGFPLPQPGPYSFDVVWENELLGSLRVVADYAAKQGGS